MQRGEEEGKGSQGRGSKRWVPHRGQVPAMAVRAGLRDRNKTLCPGRAGERRRETWVSRVIPACGWQAPALLSSEATSPSPLATRPSASPRLTAAKTLPTSCLFPDQGLREGPAVPSIQEGQRKLTPTWSREGRPQAPGAPLMGLHHHLGAGQRPSLRPETKGQMEQPTLAQPPSLSQERS